MQIENKEVKFFGLLCLSAILLVSLTISTYSNFASAQNNTLIQPQGTQGMSTNVTNATNIVLVHGDGLMEQDGQNKFLS
jgi:hypothetical protein